VGAPVNLEPSHRAGDALGGHLVSGHIDGVGRISALGGDARSRRLTVEAPPALARYLAVKGSIALDGVSLTINSVEGASFGVNIIPHTQTATTLGGVAVGTRVNLEVDQLARYLARLLAVPAS
jgi:riboflavin synthase